jgi:hypothetical protein
MLGLSCARRRLDIDPARLTNLMRSYVQRAALGKSGACHIFREVGASHAFAREPDRGHDH